MATAVDIGSARIGQRSKLVAAAVGVLLIEALLGAAVASGHQTQAVFAVLGAALAVLVVRYPFAGSVLFLVLVASVFAGEPPKLYLGGRAVFPYELLLTLLLALAIARPRRRTWGGGAGLALALFLGMLLLSSTVAIRDGSGSLNDILLWGRSYYALTFFWVVVRLFPERRELLRLLGVAALIGGVTGFVALLFGVGVSPDALFSDPGHTAVADDASSALRRVRLPGLALSFGLLWLVILFIARGVRPRWLWWLCLAGCLLDVLVSQNRNMWIAGLAGLAMMLVVTGPRVRSRIVASVVVLGAALALLVLLPQTSASTSSALQPIVERGETLLNPGKVEEESSLQDRENETRAAWANAQDHLLIGIAPGVSWGLYIIDKSSGAAVATPQLFLHNQYLYILVITGIPGLLLLLLFLSRTAFDGLADPRRAPVEAMLGIAVVAFMLTAVVMLSLSDTSYLVAIALLAGSISALRAGEPPR
jgi:O-antigen ligase